MKTILTYFIIILSFNSISQTTDYLKQLFYGTISKDEFIMSQKYSYIDCSGYEYFADGSTKKINLSEWVYKQNFEKYSDTSKYIINYEKIKSYGGILLESIIIYERSSMYIDRTLLNSYYPNSNIMSGLHDSELDF